MIRIPGSHNSKCISKKDGRKDQSTEIKIIQRWNGFRPKINFILGEYHAYLVQQRLIEIRREKQLNTHRQTQRFGGSQGCENGPNSIAWIEKLLITPTDDFRRNAVCLILASYLINVRGCSSKDTYDVIKEWTDRCSAVRRLDSNFGRLIKYAIHNAMKNGYKPLRLENLRQKNGQLYNVLVRE